MTNTVLKSFVLFCFLSLGLGCSSSDGPSTPTAKELTVVKKSAINGSEEELFEKAKRSYTNNLYSSAKDVFEQISRTYPQGAYGSFAQIKAADASFAAGDYPDAATRYEHFVAERPGSEELDYVLLRLGRSRQLSNHGAGRDPSSLLKAKESYEKLLKEYPNSLYLNTARLYYTETLQVLKEHFSDVADFYQRKGNSTAYEARARKLEETMAPSYVIANTELPSKKPVLTTKIMGAQNQQLIKSPALGIPKAGAVLASLAPRRIEGIECTDKAVFILLSHLPEKFTKNLRSSDNLVHLRLSGFTTPERKLSCIDIDDVSLTNYSEGVDSGAEISITGVKLDGKSEQLNYPPRIALSRLKE